LVLYGIVVVASYLLGSIPFGYVLVRVFRKQDIRATGSGNIGATNVARSGAKGLAILTLLLDAGKGALAVWVAESLARQHLAAEGHSPGAPWPYVLGAMAAMFAVAGHIFPVWLKFRGGKGVATAVGAFAVLAPLAVLVALAVFGVTVAVTRFVSLGSILGTISFPIAVYLLPHERLGFALWHVLGAIVITGAMVIAKHHANIARLLARTENKLGAKPIPSPAQVEKQA
jgi:glycerol-3-phosphate acyltransferase PlsY